MSTNAGIKKLRDTIKKHSLKGWRVVDCGWRGCQQKVTAYKTFGRYDSDDVQVTLRGRPDDVFEKIGFLEQLFRVE